MRNLITCSAYVLIAGTSASAVGARQIASATARPTCDAKYYSYLVGKGLDEARSIEGTNYRVVPNDSARGEANPKRMTIVYDSKSNQITEVACG